MNAKRIQIEGIAIPLKGNDIDTDRIIPARYLKTVIFDGLGEHVFEDDRVGMKNTGLLHPFDDPAYKGARILIANRNFGCGSSREHAPQALMRFGIQAIVAESFAEIFFGNCLAIGIPCCTCTGEQIKRLQQLVTEKKGVSSKIDISTCKAHLGDFTYGFTLPPAVQKQFVEGSWDTSAELLTALDKVKAKAATLPYFTGYSD